MTISELEAALAAAHAENRELRAKLEEVEAHLDLMVDEFKRIIAIVPNLEVEGICTRAITQTRQRVPVIEQRDKTERERDEAQARLKEAREVLERWYKFRGKAPFNLGMDTRTLLEKLKEE
jgi:seryl-tRNA synthetase